MSRFARTRPSPAMVVACVALSFALAGTAVAGTEAVSSKLDKKEKKQTKRIAKRQANKQINKKASGLSVANAQNAVNAQNATNATNAGTATNAKSLDMYAHVTISGTDPNVDESRSRGFTDDHFDDTGFVGEYCVTLPPEAKVVHGTVDTPLAGLGSPASMVTIIENASAVCATVGSDGTHVVEVRNFDGLVVDDNFDISVGL